MSEIEQTVIEIGRKAKSASRALLGLSSAVKNSALARLAVLLDENRSFIQEENRKDLDAAKKNSLPEAMIDRLTLSDAVIDSMISALHEVVALDDPVGTIRGMTKRPNGMTVGRMHIPLGVIGMIYESRPNVTVDAAALCLKTGNAVILRGGSEAILSNTALAQLLQSALEDSGIAKDAVQLIPVTDRKAVEVLLKQEETIDLIIPRGGEGLIRFVAQNSSIPVLKHYKGVCHIFVDSRADLQKATPIIVNSKVQRPGVCNALEGLLIHDQIAGGYLPGLAERLVEEGVRLFGCQNAAALSPHIEPAAEDDWGKEFLDLSLVVKVVTGFDEAREYINTYGSNHTECIITEDYSLANRFVREIDASAVLVNASTRFNDGGQLGLGTEIGISTTKLHAYGPMGLEELTTRKFVVYGEGQVRS